MPYETTAFTGLAVASLVAFAVGAALRWRRSALWSDEDGQPAEMAWSAVVCRVLGFTRAGGADGALARASHVMLIWGFIILAAVCVLANLSHVIGWVRYRPDAAGYAVPGDLGGVALLVGSVCVIAQRLRFRRKARAPSDLSDAPAAACILAVVVSGYVVESLRMLSEPAARSDDFWSFIGAAVAALISTPSIDWYGAWLDAWWVHAGLSLALIAYLPHTRLFRHFFAPVAAALRARSGGGQKAAASESHASERGVGRGR